MKALKLLLIITVLLIVGCQEQNNPILSNNEIELNFTTSQGQIIHQDMNVLYPCGIVNGNEQGVRLPYDYRLQKVWFKYGDAEYRIEKGLNEYLYSKDFRLFVGMYCDQENYIVVKAYHEEIGMMERARWDLGHIIIDKSISVKVFLTYN